MQDMIAPKRPPTLLAASYSLLDELAEGEASWARLYARLAPNVTGIVMTIPAWQQDPNAINHPLVQTAARAIHAAGLDLILSQDLFRRWGPEQDRWDVMRTGYYVAYLKHLRFNADALWAKGTAVEGEPYGDSIYNDDWFKETGFNDRDAARVQRAIRDALLYAEQADYVYPAGWGSPEGYPWSFAGLGKGKLHHVTYEARHASDVKLVHPPDMEPELHWWGSYLKPDGEPGSGPLTVPEFFALDLATIQKTYPECTGFWAWVHRDDMVAVMRQLGGGRRG